jgi:hypothetical protein
MSTQEVTQLPAMRTIAIIAAGILLAMAVFFGLRATVFADHGTPQKCLDQYTDTVRGLPVTVTSDCADFVYG